MGLFVAHLTAWWIIYCHVILLGLPGTKKTHQLYYCYSPDRAKEESWITGSTPKQKGERRLVGCFGSLHFTWARGEISSSPCRLWQKAWVENYPLAWRKETIVARFPWVPWSLGTALAMRDHRALNGAPVQQNTVYIFKAFCLPKARWSFPIKTQMEMG